MEEHNIKSKIKKPQVSIPYDEFMKQTMQDGADGENHEVFSALMCTDEDYAWVTSGSRLYVVNTKTGSYLSYYNFSDPDELPGQTQYITFVQQFFVKGYSLPFLIVSTNTSKEGFISIFNPMSWMIKRRVNIGRQISCLAVVDNDSMQGCLSKVMSGILAVGCTDGSLILIDLRSDALIDTSNLPLSRDSEASNLKFININDNLENVLDQKLTCMQNGDSLAFLLLKGKPGYHGVSALYHSKESGCLFVGFGRGSWEVWDVMRLNLMHSMSSESDYPVYSFAQLEPCDDPKHVLYIWVTHQINSGSIAIMSLYSFAFGKKTSDHRGRHYMEFRACALVFEFFPDNLFLHAEGGKLISCFSLPIKNSKKYSKLPLTDDPKALVFTGLSVDYKKSSRSYLIVFDLDQWYKSQMPSSTLGATPYLDLVTVTDCAVEGIDVFRRSLKFNNKGTHEVYSYPQSLSYDILCSCTSQFINVKKPSLQASWFQNVSKLGSDSLFNSFTLCKEAIRAGIIPKFSDPINIDLSSEKQTREYLMSIFLDYNLTSAIHDAIVGWCKATKNSEDDHWSFVFDWMWDTVSKIWEKANSVCSKFFDGSGVNVEHIGTDYIYYSAKTIESLVHLLTDIARNKENQIFEDKIQQKLSSMRGMVLYLKFVHLFAKENLLPEKNIDGQPESSLHYDYKLLLTKSEALRNDLKTKFFSKFNHCLLPKTSLYLFDHVVGDFGLEIYQQWEKEGGTSTYPPSTIQSLLRICLLQNISENVIFCIFHYFILDMIHLLPNEQYSSIKKLEEFEEKAFSKNEEYFILKGIWMLDHLLFKEGLDCFFHPKSRTSSLPSEMHKAILLNFMVHDQEKIAYKYLSANGNCFSDLDDIKLEFQILLSQGMPQEAYDFLRKKKNYKNELFNQLLEASLNSPSLRDFIAKGDLDSHERKLCEIFFNNNNSLPVKRFHAFYLIHHKRYLEANTIQKKIRSNASSDSLLKNIAKGFYSTMSSYSKDKEECQRLQETQLAAHFVTKSAFPKPLSCFIKVGKDMSMKNVSSGKELMLAVEASSFHLNNLRKRKEMESYENAKKSDQTEIPESEVMKQSEDSHIQMASDGPESPMVVDTTLDLTLSTTKRSSNKRQGRRWEIPESKRRKVETLSTPTKWTSPPNFGGTPLVKKEAPIVAREKNLTHSILKSTPRKQDESSTDSVNLTPRKNIRFCVPENLPDKIPEENIAVSSTVDFKTEENVNQETFSHDNIQEVNEVEMQPASPSKIFFIESNNLNEELEDSFNDSYSLGFGYHEERVTKPSVVIEEIDLISDSDGNDSQPEDAHPTQQEEQNEEDVNYDDDYYSSDKGSDEDSPSEQIQGLTAPSNFESASADDDSSLEVVEIVRNVKAPSPQIPKVEFRQNEWSLERTNVYENSSSHSSPLHYSRKSQSATTGRANIYDTESSQSSSLHYPSNPQGAISDMIMDMVDEENSSKFSGSSEESSHSSSSSHSSAEDVEVADEEEEEDEEIERASEGNRQWDMSEQDPLYNELDYEQNPMETEIQKEEGSRNEDESSEDDRPPYNPLDFQTPLDYDSNHSASLEVNKLPGEVDKPRLDSADDKPVYNTVDLAPMDSAASMEVAVETPVDYPEENPTAEENNEGVETPVDYPEENPTAEENNECVEAPVDYPEENPTAEENNEEDVLYAGLSAEESEEIEKVAVCPEERDAIMQPSFKEDENSLEPPEENEEKTSPASENSDIGSLSLFIEDEGELDMTENTTVMQSTVRLSETNLNETDTITQEKEETAPCLERIESESELVNQEKEETAPLLERIVSETDIVEEKEAPHLERIHNEPDHVEMEHAPQLERIISEPDPVQLEHKDPAPSLQIESEPTDVEMEIAEPGFLVSESHPIVQEKEDSVRICEAATPKAPKYGRKRKYTQPLTPGYALRRSNERLNMAMIEDSPKQSQERRSKRSQRASSAEPILESSQKLIHESLMVIEEERSDDLPSTAPSGTSRTKTKTPSKKALINLSFEDSPQVLDQAMLASHNSTMDLTPTPTVKAQKGRKKPGTPGIALKKGKKYQATPGHALKAAEALPLSEDEGLVIEKEISPFRASVDAASIEEGFARAASVESIGKSEKATRSSKRIAMRQSMECLDTSVKELPKRTTRASSVDSDRFHEKSIKRSSEKARSIDNLASQSSTQRSRFGRIDFSDCDPEHSEDEDEKPKKRQIKSRRAVSSASDLEPLSQRLKEFDHDNKSSKKSTKTSTNDPSPSTRKRGRPKKLTLEAFLKPKVESSRPLEKIAEEEVETEENLKEKQPKKEAKGLKSRKESYSKTLEQLFDKQSKERGTLLRSGKLVSYSAQTTLPPRKASASSKSKPSVKKEQPSKKELYKDDDDFKMFD